MLSCPLMAAPLVDPHNRTLPRILVVDDEEVLARGLAELLETKGFQTAVALSAEEALAQIANAAPDVVISDFMMPRITAVDLYGELERQYPNLCRRFILIGGDLSDFPVRAFVDTKGIPSFSKPFDLHEVIQIVRAMVEGARRA